MSVLETARPSSKTENLTDLLDSSVAKWFSSVFREPTPPQRTAISSIKSGKNTLIASPTGSGKTLSAFLPIIDELVRLSKRRELEDTVYCVYVSPLRSLNNDVLKNISSPISEIFAEERELDPIRVAVRTGDSTASERTKMLRRPPHILITTPETLAILLVAPKFREHLRSVRWTVVDEIHELCSSKRGVHLTLSLERLQALCTERTILRIGLSATINPVDQVAGFLVGFEEAEKQRECAIVDARFARQVKLSVISASPDLVHASLDLVFSEMYGKLNKVIEKGRTTLVFTNTRSMAERVAFHLSQEKKTSLSNDDLGAHHGSLSTETRRSVEDRLKRGEMRAVVTSTSLELGVDIGSIDTVFQIGSPKSITRCLQRAGRSGHSLEREPCAVLFASDRDDLIELATIASEARKGNLDRIYVPKQCLDVLAQHLVGMAAERKWDVVEAYETVRRSYCYRDLSMDTFRRVLEFLSGRYGALEEYKVYGRIWYDEERDCFGKKGWMSRVIYATNIGTIPDSSSVSVFTRVERKWVGEIQEDFLEKLNPGDLFLLGGKTYKFAYAKGFKAFAERVDGARPTVPIWSSESLPLSFDLGECVSRFRSNLLDMIRGGVKDEEILKAIIQETNCDEGAAAAILAYVKAQASFLKFAGVSERFGPSSILVENYIDHDVRQNFIFTCTFGRRVNEALARTLGQRMSEKRHGNILVNVSDCGFVLTLPAGVYLQPSLLFSMLHTNGFSNSLSSAIKRSEMLKRRFRQCCVRSLMILRNYRGKENSVQKQQINSQILLSLCERLPAFPILEEAYREVMEDLMDMKTAVNVLRDIEQGTRKVIVCKRSNIPSPFAHGLIVRGTADVILMAERKEALRELYDSVMSRVYGSKNSIPPDPDDELVKSSPQDEGGPEF